ncbi:MAG: biopolymer transporter ExbD [Oligoflexia bacterium]|nr:biopolymer transporter ExbD [Oligoflexia bacterium]
MSKSKQEVDYQLDLTPFISLLSVCICFLLLTVAWFQVGALSVKQVMGAGAGEEKQEDKLTLWVYMKSENKIEIRLKKGSQPVSQKIIDSLESAFDFQKFKKYVGDLKSQQADLNEVFIFPQEKAVYEDIVKIMDGVRQAGIFSMGLAPI